MIDIRTFHRQDIAALVKLINEADAVDRKERATTIADLEHRLSFPCVHPETDFYVAWEDGQAVGYVGLQLSMGATPSGSIVNCWGVVHPQRRRQGLGRRLLEAAELRGGEIVAQAGEGPANMQCVAHEDEAGSIALFESRGMRRVRYFVNLARAIGNGLPPLIVPDGIRLRQFRGNDDLEVVWRVEGLAFRDHWNATEAALEDFVHWVTLDYFRPELWFLAEEEATGKVVGLGLNMINPDWIAKTGRQEGYVDTLAVLREHRQRGLGTALLVRSLRALKEAGMEYAHLHADAENLTGAMRLYRRAGFHVRRTLVAYHRKLR